MTREKGRAAPVCGSGARGQAESPKLGETASPAMREWTGKHGQVPSSSGTKFTLETYQLIHLCTLPPWPSLAPGPRGRPRPPMGLSHLGAPSQPPRSRGLPGGAPALQIGSGAWQGTPPHRGRARCFAPFPHCLSFSCNADRGCYSEEGHVSVDSEIATQITRMAPNV